MPLVLRLRNTVGHYRIERYRKYASEPEPCAEDASVEELKAECKRRRRQLRNAEIEREILNKATAYFAKESR